MRGADWRWPMTRAIETRTPTLVTGGTAVSGGAVVAVGGPPITRKGVCWSTSPSPTLRSDNTDNGAGPGEFASALTGLTPGATYYIRAYAQDGMDTYYGNEIEFVASELYGTRLLGTDYYSDVA